MFALRIGFSHLFTTSAENPRGRQYGPYKVSFVVDGDTVILNTGDKIRLKGIDAPEIHHPLIPVQRFGEEAKEYMKSRVEGLK